MALQPHFAELWHSNQIWAVEPDLGRFKLAGGVWTYLVSYDGSNTGSLPTPVLPTVGLPPLQVSRLEQLCAKTEAQRDDLSARVKQLEQRTAPEAAGQQGSASGGGPAAWTGEVWQDAVRLTERVAEVTSANAEILSENSALTKQLEVRLGCEHPPCVHVVQWSSCCLRACVLM